jgi:arsenite methyltransferase
MRKSVIIVFHRGRIVISDMTSTGESKKEIDYEEWAECIAGAITTDEYRALLQQAGFQDISYSDEDHSISDVRSSTDNPARSFTWLAKKTEP